jgi:hypothetical protein
MTKWIGTPHRPKAVILCFNPRSRRGSDQLPGSLYFNPCMFQSTLPQGERRWCQIWSRAPQVVSIHAPAGGATHTTRNKGWRGKRFNPRSRRGSDTGATADNTAALGVSIHAPAGGATWGSSCPLGGSPFQSTLPQGERRVSGGIIFQVSGFNPRSRRGSDTQHTHQAAPQPLVSIHAPAGGATEQWFQRRGVVRVSIHAPAGGATKEISTNAAACPFQSTLPQGERHRLCFHFRELGFVSIHAPAGGATHRKWQCVGSSGRFNPRSRRGRDIQHSNMLGLGLGVSIHAPAGGATNVYTPRAPGGPCFNPRSRRGSDLPQQRRVRHLAGFNPRSRRGSDRPSPGIWPV